jgi:RNA polymerase sigma-32 factor
MKKITLKDKDKNQGRYKKRHDLYAKKDHQSSHFAPNIIEEVESSRSSHDEHMEEVLDQLPALPTMVEDYNSPDRYGENIQKSRTGKPQKTIWDEHLKRYFQEIARYPLLTLEEEKKLTQEFLMTGDLELAKKLVQANLRLVVKIALEYRYAYHNVLDLIQEGNIGLMKAVSKFDPSKGAKLSYYASWWIKSYILKFILDNFRLVKIGTTGEQKKLFYNLLKEKERLLGQGIAPETKLLSETLGVSEKNVVLMDQRLGPKGGEVSLDRPLKGDGTQTWGDFLEDEHSLPEDQLAQEQGLKILTDKLEGFLQNLPYRDREIFEKRLLSEIPPSLQQIADEYGVSRERIRQIEERLMKKLKVYMSEFIR